MFNVPNLFSLGNLLCGCIATLTVIEGNLFPAAFLVMLASVFDFLDGFAARGLKQGSPMGKELDSLADMVTFGVVPGMVMFQLIRMGINIHGPENYDEATRDCLPYAGFFIPLFSALRLAHFNVDTKQSTSFIGLPTLANALLITGIPLAIGLTQQDFAATSHGGFHVEPGQENDLVYLMISLHPTDLYSIAATNLSGNQIPWFYDLPALVLMPFWMAGLSALMSMLLISKLPMFSFKVKNVKWKGNEVRYVFLAGAVLLAVLLQLKALSVIIVLYVLMSLVNSMVGRKEQRQ